VAAREFHDETMRGPHFCPMKITEDVRRYADKYRLRLKLCFQAIQ
jgi:hypothetical protein